MSRHRKPEGETLLEQAARTGQLKDVPKPPLAERMRPTTLEEVLGQEHLLGPGKWLRRALEADAFPSLILWGPPGVGKTSIARVLAETTKRRFVPFSAVLGGVPELRTLLAEADENRRFRGLGTVLFVDEMHRFNRAQQDAFLPHVERGTVTLVGATTENPTFALNAAVLSRATVARLEPLTAEHLRQLLARALADTERGLGRYGARVTTHALAALARAADGDARRALGLLELLVARAIERGAASEIGAEDLEGLLDQVSLRHDRTGDEHFDLLSAFIKSMRGSDPDAAVYYLMRMVEAGEDPTLLLRRMIVFASEDVGNTDPRALPLAIAADEAYRRLGLPEGLYPLTHACLFLASCPKSGAVGPAFHGARALIAQTGSLPVPKHLRNAPTALAKSLGHGEGYRSPHEDPRGYVPGETYLPDELAGTRLYAPSEHGLERAIKEKLAAIRAERAPRDK
jgi:putative ATPase